MSASTNSIVTLTGGKNNSGDFLIKARGIKLLKRLNPNTTIHDLNAWEQLSEENLDLVNRAKILCLLGGPSVQFDMYPKIYALTPNLDDILVPIVTMGVGTKPKIKSAAPQQYPLSSKTLSLLERINTSGFKSSVRDFHTLYTLENLGLNSFFTTGCPALFSPLSAQPISGSKNAVFSAGVSFCRSRREFNYKVALIEKLHELFAGQMIVALHHGTSSSYLKTNSPNQKLFYGQCKLIEHLDKMNIQHKDVSGSADKMIELYMNCGLHIGYRVHAHILMVSENKPSILLAEDGRATSLQELIGGMITIGTPPSTNLKTFNIQKLAKDFALRLYSLHISEKKHQYPRLRLTQKSIEQHWSSMQYFLNQFNSSSA